MTPKQGYVFDAPFSGAAAKINSHYWINEKDMTVEEKTLEDYVASKVNNGVRILNNCPIGRQATIAATGLGRSGTTMLGRILGDIGLEMGEHRHPNTYDDKEIQTIARRQEWERFDAVCRARDAKSDIWAFKDPKIRSNLSGCVSAMRNPRLIVTFRDILAVSIRNEISAKAEIWNAMRVALKGYAHLLNQLSTLDCPILVISYEKCLMRPEETVTAIAEFCGVSLPPEEIRRIATETIRESDPLYLSYNYDNIVPS